MPEPEVTQEQTGVYTNEADDPQLGAEVVTTPVADSAEPPAVVVDTQPAAEVTPPEPTTPTDAPPALDLSSLEAIRAAADTNPLLREYREQGFEAGRQKREQELRREQGSVERAHQVQAALFAKYGLEMDADDAKNLPLFVSANEQYVRAELSKQLLEGAVALVGPEQAAALRAQADSLEGKPDELPAIAQSAIAAAVAAAGVRALSAVQLADIPEGSQLLKDINAKVEAAVTTELAARELAAKQASREQQAPRTPTGAPSSAAAGPQTADEWHEAYAYGRVKHAEYKEAMTGLGVKLRA